MHLKSHVLTLMSYINQQRSALEVDHTYSLSGSLPISSRIRCHWIRVLSISQLKKEKRDFAGCRPHLCSLQVLNYNYRPVEKLKMYVESSLEFVLICVAAMHQHCLK